MKKIIFIELNFSGEVHLNINASFVGAHRHAFPNAEIHIIADASHIDALKNVLKIENENYLFEHNISLKKIQKTINRSGLNYYLAPFKRLFLIYAKLGTIKPQMNDRIFFLSNNEFDFFSVYILKKILYTNMDISLVCHGNLNSIYDWQSNNPIRKFFNYRNSLKRLANTDNKLIVLEQSLKYNLLKEISILNNNISVIHHPLLPFNAIKKDSKFPLRIAFVGEINKNKRFDLFEKLAKELDRVCKNRFTFDVIGRSRQLDLDCSIYGIKPSKHFLDSKEMESHIINIDFICMFQNDTHYRLSASGVFVDAIRFLKPVIHLNSKIVIDNETRFGELGIGGSNIEEISNKLHNLTDTDYSNMLTNLERLKSDRSIEATSASLVHIFD